MSAGSYISAHASKLLDVAGECTASMVICFTINVELQTQINSTGRKCNFSVGIFSFIFHVLIASLYSQVMIALLIPLRKWHSTHTKKILSTNLNLCSSSVFSLTPLLLAKPFCYPWFLILSIDLTQNCSFLTTDHFALNYEIILLHWFINISWSSVSY